MYSSTCPNCGHLIPIASNGLVYVRCPLCAWVGSVATLPAPTAAPEPSEPSESERRAARLGQQLYALTNEVAGRLSTLTKAEWDLPLERRYEAIQTAHTRFFEVLGGVRMGDYRPQTEQVRLALVELLLRELLALDSAE